MKLYEILDGKRKEKMFSCIYLWTNLVNDKHYVGQTQHFYDRMYMYKTSGATKILQNAINKYGIDNFDIQVIEKCDIDKLDEREQYWIDYYNSYESDKGYNICRYASTTRGYHHTDEVKAIMSQKAKEHAVHRFGEENPMYGKVHPEEWRKEHSKWLKNKWATDEEYRNFWSKKMSGENNYFYGKHFCGASNPNAHPVICVETGETFDTMKEAGEYYGVYKTCISQSVNKGCATKGLHFKRI
jgi:group I intron endonuclease